MTIAELHEHYLKCTSICTDTRKITNGTLFFALKGDNFNGNTFAEKALNKGALFAVIDDISYQKNDQYIVVDNVLEALQQLATYHRKYLKIPIIALTGSNGKTTTKELINSVLSTTYQTTATIGNLNNHIGVPLTLLSMNEHTEIGIVEMGANHQKEIEFLTNIAFPDYGLITNFGKAHLEGFGGLAGVIKGKSEMYDHLIDHHKTVFVNENDQLQNKLVGNYDNIIKFGSQIELLSAQPFVTVKFKNHTIATKLTGAYNFNNICVAIAIGIHFNVSDEQIIYAINAYTPNNNRSQIIEKNGHQIILDAYNANPTSMVAALSNFNQLSSSNKIAFLGDMFELGNESESEHQLIAEFANSLNFEKVILIGENFYNTETLKTVSYYKSFNDFKEKFNDFHFEKNMILIKGSRGMALERVLELL